MGTGTVAWTPLPLPCLSAGVRTRRATRGYSCAVFGIASMYRAGCTAYRRARSVTRSDQVRVHKSLTTRSLNCFRRQLCLSQTGYPMFQKRPSRPTRILGYVQPIHDLCRASSSQCNSSAHVWIACRI